MAGATKSPRAPRFALAIFTAHLGTNLLLGYGLIPRFQSLIEPPPAPPSYRPVLVAAIRLVNFPLVTLAESVGIAGFSRPNLLLVALNSALLAGVVVFMAATAKGLGHPIA